MENNLITVEDLGMTLKDFEEFVVLSQKIEYQKKLINDKVKEYMENNGIEKVRLNNVKWSYTAPYERTSVDSKALKEEQPEIYNKYSKTTKVSGSVRLSIED